MTRKPAINQNNIPVTYNRSPNLKDMLVKSKVYFLPQPKLSQPCWQSRCLTCPHMNTSQVISNKANHSYPTRGNFPCKSTNIIYVMTCNVCNIQYVGETSNTINNRCRGHGNSIRAEKNHPVAIHYRSYNHTIDNYSITTVYTEPDKNRRPRLQESWMTLLSTLTPKGLNGIWYSQLKNWHGGQDVNKN